MLKRLLQGISRFHRNRFGAETAEQSTLLIVIVIVAGLIAAGFATHLNSNAKTATTQMDSSITDAQTKASALTQP